MMSFNSVEGIMRLRSESDANEATNAESVEVRAPGDALSSDEETCLLILAEGGYMAPIGKWAGPLESLTQRGLAKMLDAANYVVTERGKLVATKKDTEFYTDWINASNKAVERKSALAGGFVEHRVDPGRSTDEVDDVNAPIARQPDALRIGDDVQLFRDPAYVGKPTMVYGLTLRQVQALMYFYTATSGKNPSEICPP